MKFFKNIFFDLKEVVLSKYLFFLIVKEIIMRRNIFLFEICFLNLKEIFLSKFGIFLIEDYVIFFK